MQVKSRVHSPAHRGDFFVDVLATIRVKELLAQLRKVRLIPEDMSFAEFRQVFSESQQHYFPVGDQENRMTGIFSINDVRAVLFDQGIGDLVRMSEVATSDIIFTTPSEDLEVRERLYGGKHKTLPVVDAEGRLTGILAVSDC